MAVSASNINNLSSFAGALAKSDKADNGKADGSIMSNANKRDSLMQKINNADLMDDGQANGSMFKQDALKESYLAINKASDPESKQKAQDKFIDDLLKADAEDNETFDGSVFKDGVDKEQISDDMQKSISKSDVFRMLVSYDKVDDNSLNGSVFDNKNLVNYLDLVDDGKQNGSIKEFIEFLKNPFEDAYGNKVAGAKDGAVQGYNVLNPNGSDRGLSNQIDNTLSSYDVPKFQHNPSQFYGSSPVDKANYNYSIKPDSILGDGVPEKAAKIALGEIGVSEANGKYTKYGQPGPWCAAFVTWAYTQANDGKNPWAGWNSHYVPNVTNWAKQNGLYTTDVKEAKAGDAIIFQNGGDKSTHIGIITKIDPDGTIHTIEGNTSDKVAERTYGPGNQRVQGFVKMNEYNQIAKNKQEKEEVKG